MESRELCPQPLIQSQYLTLPVGNGKPIVNANGGRGNPPLVSAFVSTQTLPAKTTVIKGESIKIKKVVNADGVKKEKEKYVNAANYEVRKAKEGKAVVLDGGKQRKEEKPVVQDGGKEKEEKAVNQDGGRGKEEKPVFQDGGKRKEEKAVVVDGGKRKEEKPVVPDGGRVKEEKVVVVDGGRGKEEKPVVQDGGKRKEEKPVLPDGGRGKEEKPVVQDGGKRKEEKAAILDSGRGKKEKAVVQDGSKGKDEKPVAHDGGIEKEEKEVNQDGSKGKEAAILDGGKRKEEKPVVQDGGKEKVGDVAKVKLKIIKGDSMRIKKALSVEDVKREREKEEMAANSDDGKAKEEKPVVPDGGKGKDEKPAIQDGGRGKEKERQMETAKLPSDNSQGLKMPEPDVKLKLMKIQSQKRLSIAAQGCTAAEEKAPNYREKEDFPALEKKLREFNFYHGFLPREDLQSTLISPGDYLLRVSEVIEREDKVNREVILSLIPIHVEGKDDEEKKKCRNVVIKRVSNLFFCETTRTFSSIDDLINYYTKNTGSCSAATFQLKNPILQQPWEFMHSDVTVGRVLGEGAFGKVCSGTLKLKDGTTVDVAIKMTKVSAFLSKMKIKEMMNEARFIRNFNHKNVVRLYGVAHDEQPLYILLELVKGGTLQDHMRKAKASGSIVSLVDRMRLCCGIGRGLEYLHQNHCIHRDIAARNCLLHEKEVKITDFGLSRTGPTYKMKTSCKLPVKWLAPETLSTLSFSYETDVYSWGITCYEVFADGAEPFEGVSNAVVKADILNNRFLQFPPSTPEIIRKFMSLFIFIEASKRVSMTVAVNDFERVLAKFENEAVDSQNGPKNLFLKVFGGGKRKKYEKNSKVE